ncbi:DUF58 domain-containing protein [Dehalococcoides mccartyi]|nr:DUF58 domain-containing protein [Dehalococcoides mccartyi]
MITKRGIGFVLTAVAAFFIASATRVGWVHLADAILWGVIILSAVTPWISVYGLSVKREKRYSAHGNLPGPVEGRSFEVDLHLTNKWWIPRFLLNVQYSIESQRGETNQSLVLIGVSPRSKTEGTTTPQLSTRGKHELSEVTVESMGLFGLFKRRRKFTSTDSILVFPSWEQISRIGILDSSMGMSEGVSKSRSGIEVAGTRRYVAGDAYRNIHWRNSARTGRLVVKEFDSWSERSVAILIDADELPTHAAGDRSSDYAVRLAATAAAPLSETGGTIRIVTTEGGHTRASWSDTMIDLAQIEDQPAGTAARWAEEIKTGERVLAFVHSSNTELLASLTAMARSGSEIAAVVFEGFMPGDDAANAIKTLTSVGVTAMSCRLGEFSKAVSEMEHGIGAGRHTISAPTPATEPITTESEELAA